MVAVSMDAGRRHEAGEAGEAGEAVEELEGSEGSEAKHLATVHLGLGEPVHQASLRRGEPSDAGKCVKPLETRSVLALDADGAVDGAVEDTEHRRCEASAGPAPRAHVRRRGGVQEPAPDEPPQNAELYRAGQRLRVSILESGGLVEADTVLDVAGDHAVESERVVVVVRRGRWGGSVQPMRGRRWRGGWRGRRMRGCERRLRGRSRVRGDWGARGRPWLAGSRYAIYYLPG